MQIYKKMGRAKVKMELIKNEKNRTKSFKSRTKILIKKAHELKTLCDVDVCVIIYSGCSSINEGRPVIVWPPVRDTIRPLIESYKKQSNEDRKRRTVDVFHFLKERNKKVEADLVKLRKSNHQSRFAPWDQRYDGCSEEQLRKIANALKDKLREATSRIEMINGCDGLGAQDGVGCVRRESQPYFSDNLLLKTRNIQVEVPHNQAQLANNQHQQLANRNQLDHTNNPFINPMFMMMGNNYSQLGPEYSNSLFNNNSYNPVYFNDAPSAGMIENTEFSFSQPPPMAFYTPYMQYPMGSSSSSQMSATQMEMCYNFSNFNTGVEKAHRS